MSDFNKSIQNVREESVKLLTLISIRGAEFKEKGQFLNQPINQLQTTVRHVISSCFTDGSHPWNPSVSV